MCGRTACTHQKCSIQRATCQYNRNKEAPQWIQKYDWQDYKPSYNLSPSQISPVLISDAVVAPYEKLDNYVIMPMRWGFIPSWFKGRLEDYTLKTNNCRCENLLEKPTYRGAATAGFRCVILADGFYEWKVIGNRQKQPYFIYFPQEKGSDVFTKQVNLYEDKKWNGPRLLTMAGLFDIWKSSQNEIIYSYSVITMDSSKTVSFVHDRMPAILDGEDQVSMWLDNKRVPIKEAIANLKAIDNLEMHPVSTLVNNSRNNSVECLVKKDVEKKSPTAFKHTPLTAWLQKGSTPLKRLKTELNEDVLQK